MANHKSAKKRTRQTLKRKLINNQILSQLKTNITSQFVERIHGDAANDGVSNLGISLSD